MKCSISECSPIEREMAMPDLHVQNLPENVIELLKQKANEGGIDLQDWLRQQIIALAHLPSLKKGLNITCKSNDGKSLVTIMRTPYKQEMRMNAKVTSVGLRDIVDEASNYLSRNQPGDVEHALKMLKLSFDEVLVE